MHTEKTVAQQESSSLWELRPLPLTFQIKTLRPHFIFFFYFQRGNFMEDFEFNYKQIRKNIDVT